MAKGDGPADMPSHADRPEALWTCMLGNSSKNDNPAAGDQG